MIVVDANVLAYLYLPREFTAAADALLECEPEWAVPILWRSEPGNILVGYMRRGFLSFEQATNLQKEAEGLLAGNEFEVESRVVLELARDSDCSAYDCEFVALALRLDLKLATTDEKLLRAFPKRVMALSAG